MGVARRPASGDLHRHLTLNRTLELRDPGHVPTPPRPQTGFARGRPSPRGRPHFFASRISGSRFGVRERHREASSSAHKSKLEVSPCSLTGDDETVMHAIECRVRRSLMSYSHRLRELKPVEVASILISDNGPLAG